MIGAGEHDLLLRVLADAERRAADGYVREGVVLLRWAARIVTRERLPQVLLSYHRIVGIERRSGAPAEARVKTESQPTPLPQFPEIAPAVERNAFVPVQEVARAHRTDSTMVNRPPHVRGTGNRIRWMAVLGASGALILMLQSGSLSLARFGTPDATIGRSDPERSEAPGLLLTRAREVLASGDSTRARAHLRQVLEDARTSVAEYAEAAGLLIQLDASGAPPDP